jgi:hypothetical protein
LFWLFPFPLFGFRPTEGAAPPHVELAYALRQRRPRLFAPPIPLQSDVTREKAAFEISCRIVSSQQNNVNSKTWWLVRDNLRGQAYNMKANMRAINNVLEGSKKAEATAAYNKFWKEVDSLDLACQKKELALAQKEYGDVLEALKAYRAIAGA